MTDRVGAGRARRTVTRRPPGAPAAAAVVLLALLAGCAPGDGGSGGEGDAPADAATYEPIVAEDFPDPDVVATDDGYVLYATNDSQRNVQVATSDDLVTWEVLDEDPLPELPRWVIPGKTWAPEVTEIAPGSYVMYPTTTNFSPSLQCIAAATATSPTGPFTVVGEGMLVCPEGEGGAIDAATFLDDDGTRYLLWKNDGNCCGFDTWLYAAPLAADGLSLTGAPQQLVKQTLDWEGDLVEAPTIVQRDGVYHLFYSANAYYDERYAIGHATAPAVTGPWTKDEEPFFSTDSTDGALVGPGGQDIVTDASGADTILMHAWDPNLLAREVYAFPLVWEDGVPRVDLPE